MLDIIILSHNVKDLLSKCIESVYKNLGKSYPYNIIVVDTDDALLICSKSKAQNVKKIVEQLKQKSEKEYL